MTAFMTILALVCVAVWAARMDDQARARETPAPFEHSWSAAKTTAAALCGPPLYTCPRGPRP